MKILATSLLFLCIGGLATQDRAKKATAEDTPKLIQSAAKAFEEKRYGACARDLRTALGFATTLLRGKILAAMPPAPAGFTFEDVQQDDSALVGVLAMNAIPAERNYHKEGGEGHLRIAITVDSPLVGMLGMAFGLAGQDSKTEVIGYKGDKGLLKNEDGNLTLQILIANKHLIDVSASGFDADGLLKIVDQAFVDRVIAAVDG
jgi:hypothetical protein